MKCYELDKGKIYSQVDREVSRVAASAFGEDGSSLYDAIVLTSRDKDTIYEMIDDAASALLTRLSDIATYCAGVFQFFVTDERSHNTMVIGNAIDRFIVMNICSAWMQQRYSPKADEYGARSSDALEKADRLLREKHPPIPPKHKND